MATSTTEQIISDYLKDLANALVHQDSALIQDALFDSEQHFRDALNEGDCGNNQIETIIDSYGSPKEIANYYCELETKVDFALHGSTSAKPAQENTSFFSVLKDPKVYGTLLFSLLSFPISIIYFAWTIIVGLTSLVLSVFLVGTPLLLMYLKSMQYLSLFEGRFIESLLLCRMPRRPVYVEVGDTTPFIKRLSHIVKKAEFWTSALYFGIKLPLSILVFLLSMLPIFSFALILTPIMDPVLNMLNPSYEIDLSLYWLPATVPVGTLGIVYGLKLVSFTGKIQAKLAKSLLVKT